MEAVVFDAYGTLFNLDALQTSISTLLDRVNAESMSKVWRQKQMEYAWISVLMGRYRNFDQITEAALRFALTDAGVDATESVVEELMSSYLKLPLYQDVSPLFEQLEGKTKLAILSNGTFKSLQTIADRAGILFSLDYLISVEPVRMYKPSREPYQLALDTLKCNKDQILFVSSNGWDITGAKSFGFQTAWCNRKAVPPEQLGFHPDHVVSSLEELVHIL